MGRGLGGEAGVEGGGEDVGKGRGEEEVVGHSKEGGEGRGLLTDGQPAFTRRSSTLHKTAESATLADVARRCLPLF